MVVAWPSRWRRPVRNQPSKGALAVALSLGVILCGCRAAAPESGSVPAQTSPASGVSSDWFIDRSETAGLDFVYFNGMSGQFYFPEMMGGGVALFDMDNDGDLDIYFAQGQMLGSGKTAGQATIAPRSLPLRGRLYRNDLTIHPDGTREMHVVDVTERSGINATEYGMGVDERWKEKFGIWIVRTPDDLEQHASGFYALITVCTHLGCTPNYLPAENKFKCPCHGSGYRLTGINFEGPTPRPLERARVVLADDGQILVDKSRHFQWELGQWKDPESFLKA